MKFKVSTNIILLIMAGIVVINSSCEKSWGDYYAVPEYTNIKMWDAIKDSAKYVEFVHYMEMSGFDSLLMKPETFTLFIPTNDAFAEFDLEGSALEWVMGYHIARTMFIPSNINGTRKLETYIEKFALLTKNEDGIFLDDIATSKNSQLFKDGVFYEIDKIAYPRPNLYEYWDYTNPIMADYINNSDSISLDYTQSKPIGFDDEGNTIYDSVFIITNRFERDFFPVSLESRTDEATMLTVSEEEYNEALDEMAIKLNGSFVDHNDIPADWQTEFLIPYIFKNGTFEGGLEYETFITDSLENIQGDMVPVDYSMIDPESRTICSNGIAFQYLDYFIPEKLYLEEIKYEGEDFAVNTGGDFYAWDPDLVTPSDETKSPVNLDNASASGGKFVSVNLPRASADLYSIELILPKVFPRKYKLAWRGKSSPSGVIALYVNDLYIGEFDSYDFRRPVDGVNPINDFNIKEFDVDNISSYSDIVLKMEYTDPGGGSLNGLNIDYIALIPSD